MIRFFMVFVPPWRDGTLIADSANPETAISGFALITSKSRSNLLK
jgi:hypothetical protein